MTVVWDDETSTPIAYFGDGSGIVSYDDERSICLKTEYAIDERLNGFVSSPPPFGPPSCPAVAYYLRARARMRSSWRLFSRVATVPFFVSFLSPRFFSLVYSPAPQIIWELSGDVMGDLSTPLLDSVYRKLTVARTDCAGQPRGRGPSSSEVATSEVVGVTTAADSVTQSTTADNIATQGAIIEDPMPIFEDPMPQNTNATADTTHAGTTTADMAAEYWSATEEISTTSESRADG